jgi:hypothetical protein
MANSYAARTFTIDTSTNVAGLTLLKGAACDARDSIVVAAGSLTVEAALACASITGSYTITTGTLAVVALCTPEEVKARVGIATTASDALIRTLLPGVLARFKTRTGREFMPQVTETRTFDVDSYVVRLDGCDLRPGTVPAPLVVAMHPELGADATTLTEGTDYELDLDRLTGTAGRIRLASTVNLWSQRAVRFDYASIAITGGWGIWASVGSVDPMVNDAAIMTVDAWLSKPIVDFPGVDIGTPRAFAPGSGAGWDIPIDAYRKLQAYDRNLSVG